MDNNFVLVVRTNRGEFRQKFDDVTLAQSKAVESFNKPDAVSVCVIGSAGKVFWYQNNNSPVSNWVMISGKDN